MKKYCYLALLCLCSVVSAAKVDIIVFPADSHSHPSEPEAPNSDKRVPVAGVPKCPNDKYYYYPGDQADDWVCDCKPAHVYHPQSDDCFPVYRIGPCKVGEYLILPEKKVVPECVRNPCKNDGEVMFNNNCEKLYTTEPCRGLAEEKLKTNVLDINETTLEIQCIPSSSVELSIVKVNYNSCPPGSKRVSEGQCRKIIPPRRST